MSKLVGGHLPAVTLVAGLSAEEVDREARKACRYTEVGHRALAFYLAEMKRRGLHQALGHPSVVCYATRELSMSRRTARELVQVGEALAELEAIDRAFGDGEVTWSNLGPKGRGRGYLGRSPRVQQQRQ